MPDSIRHPLRLALSRQAGFAYVLLLLVVALIGLVSAATVSLGAAMARRDAEQELLAIGGEFQRALRSYAGMPVNAATASAVIAANPGRGPKSLEDLLKDPRAPGLRRHLRQVYADPLTGRAEWGLVRDAQGAIVGVYSLADGVPIQQGGFDAQWAGFEEAGSYREWVFGLAPMQVKAKPPSMGAGYLPSNPTSPMTIR
jgi:type II secretory pathway pseudopilin PulG